MTKDVYWIIIHNGEKIQSMAETGTQERPTCPPPLQLGCHHVTGFQPMGWGKKWCVATRPSDREDPLTAHVSTVPTSMCVDMHGYMRRGAPPCLPLTEEETPWGSCKEPNARVPAWRTPPRAAQPQGTGTGTRSKLVVLRCSNFKASTWPRHSLAHLN